MLSGTGIMVDQSGIVIGFRSGKGGGTLATLKYALRKQKEVHAIPVNPTNDDDVWSEEDSMPRPNDE